MNDVQTSIPNTKPQMTDEEKLARARDRAHYQAEMAKTSRPLMLFQFNEYDNTVSFRCDAWKATQLAGVAIGTGAIAYATFKGLSICAKLVAQRAGV